MSRRQRTIWICVGVLTVSGLAAAAFAFGAASLELISWIAGTLSFLVALITLAISFPRRSTADEPAASPPTGGNHFHGAFNGPVQGSGIQHNHLRGERT